MMKTTYKEEKVKISKYIGTKKFKYAKSVK